MTVDLTDKVLFKKSDHLILFASIQFDSCEVSSCLDHPPIYYPITGWSPVDESSLKEFQSRILSLDYRNMSLDILHDQVMTIATSIDYDTRGLRNWKWPP